MVQGYRGKLHGSSIAAALLYQKQRNWSGFLLNDVPQTLPRNFVIVDFERPVAAECKMSLNLLSIAPRTLTVDCFSR